MITSLYKFAYYGNWRASVVMSTTRGNYREATEAIIQLYEQYGRLTPWVVWCDGPFQLAAMHAILPKVLASEQWETISRYFKHNIYPERDWNEQWEQIWSGMIEPLVMAARQSLSHLYAEPEIFDLLKAAIFRELDRRLRAEARETDEVRQTLRRDLRNTAGYQHLGLKLTSAIFKKMTDYSVRITSLRRTMQFSGEILPADDEDASGTLTARQCAALQTVLREGMRLYDGICSDADAMIIWGSWSIPWLERYVIFRTAAPEQFYDDNRTELDALVRISNNTLGVLCTEALCFACEKPEFLSLDDRRRPHNTSGPAIKFRDGFVAFAIDGVGLDRRIVEDPAHITPEQIQQARNAEVRRIIMNIYGAERFLEEGHATLIQKDHFGELYQVATSMQAVRDSRVPLGARVAEPLVFVRVRNSTPEPDGTYKHYILRVPPHVQTAREAVAWTFGLHEHNYDPAQET